VFHPRVALASLSGASDAAWAREAETFVGAAFLGGIALCDRSRAAAREMVADRDRSEFLPPDPIRWIDDQLTLLDDADLRPGVNVRSTDVERLGAAAEVCDRHDAIFEVNAHCRQDELRAVGCGETLLADTGRLRTLVRESAATGATTSVKVRTEVDGVDLGATARAVADAGADLIHVDAMDSESEIADVASATDAFVIANNGVRDAATAHEYLDHGADAVSVGRPSDRPAMLERVRRAAEEWFAERKDGIERVEPGANG